MTDLKNYPFPRLESGSAKNIEDFFEKIIRQQFAKKAAIVKLHNALMDYVKSDKPTLFLRLYGSAKDYDLLRRGFVTEYRDGTKLVFCDNTFSMYFTGLKIAGIEYTKNDLAEYLNKKSIIVSFGLTSNEKELSWYNPSGALNIPFNALGWYQAHIKPTGYGFGNFEENLMSFFPNPNRMEWGNDRVRRINETLSDDQRALLTAHFVRLIHPLNSVLVPKNNNVIYEGLRLGEETELLEFVRNYLRTEFKKEYEEFESISLPYKAPEIQHTLGLIEWFDKSVVKPKKKKQQSKKLAKAGIAKKTKVKTKEVGEETRVEKLDDWLKSIGKTAFIEIFYPELSKDENTSLETFEKKYEKIREFKTPHTRISSAKSIIREGLEEEALLLVINSKKLGPHILETAQKYLDDFRSKKK